MEATGEAAQGLLGKIRPPRLEDAGLEDCALPPESIKEAFLKAASAVRSIVSSHTSDDEDEGRCVNDPWPTFGGSTDAVVGIEDGVYNPPGSCASEKVGGLPEFAGDEVAVKDADEKVDEVLVGGTDLPDEGKACVDGLQGLEIGGKDSDIKGKKNSGSVDNVDEEEDEKDGEKPILAEGYV
ncbi:hypothetical protein M9H77_36551 [Catharanthus roseus]|uniref:Uncharacterized protein n=1 Tax=Catharanthus roseus TaxID=4058 RepID=A0ACB9ZUP7_CATRO|nr:hypothetical protein M9H77_36551 [Catharanthus roseus]